MVNIISQTLINFSKNIWKSAGEGDTAGIRAAYYESLWKKITGKNSGTNYLDIGAGNLTNSVTFGKHFKKIYALDRGFSDENILKARSVIPDIQTAAGDAHKLPYADNMFEVVTMISLIEHVQKPDLALREAVRVLTSKGELVIQIQNKYFPVESHTGLLLVYYFPAFFRKWLLRKLGYAFYFDEVPGYPTPGEITKYLKNSADLKAIKEVILPVEVIPAGIRPLYKLAVKTRMVKIIPQSWLAVYTRR